MNEQAIAEELIGDNSRSKFHIESFATCDAAIKATVGLIATIGEKIKPVIEDIEKHGTRELEFLDVAGEEILKARRFIKWAQVLMYYEVGGLDGEAYDDFKVEYGNLIRVADGAQRLLAEPMDEYLEPGRADRSPFYGLMCQINDRVSLLKVASARFIERCNLMREITALKELKEKEEREKMVESPIYREIRKMTAQYRI